MSIELPRRRGGQCAVIGASLVLVSAAAMASTSDVKISAVCYDTYFPGEPEEAIQLINVGGAAVDISGWTIDDGTVSTVTFPAGTSIDPGQRLWLTETGTAFTFQFGHRPSVELVDSDPVVPNATGVWPGFSNTGDEVFLRDASSALVDLVVYGDSTYAGPGWNGPPATIDEQVFGGKEGQILERDRLESVPGIVADTDTAADFDDYRVWDIGASHFLATSFTDTMTVTATSAPDSNYQELIAAIGSATTTIRLNVYELTNTYIAQKLIDAINAGVDVKILHEGAPPGGIPDQEKWIAQQIEAAGGEVYFIITDGASYIHDRYTYDHAKYMVVDGARLVVGSENYGHTGHPNDPSYGNRGWEVQVLYAPLAAWYTAVFDDDLDLVHPDIKRYDAADPSYGAPPVGFVPDTTIPAGAYVVQQPAQTFTESMTVEPVVSPDSSLMTQHSILAMLDGAISTIDLEHLYQHKFWGPEATGSTATTPNVVLEAVVSAARRGVVVRVLLDSNWYNTDPSSPRDNDDTVAYLNGIAAAEGLALEARLINLGATKVEKIHNKGLIVDGSKTLIASINGSETSHKRNREAALIITSTDVAGHYTTLFDYDWTLSGAGGPGPGPGSVVINEVGWMGTVANFNHEWIELYNTTCQAINLTGWYISDDSGAQTYIIGSGVISPRGFFLIEQSEAATSVPAGSLAGLSLANAGDSLVLFDPVDSVVDTLNSTGGAWFAGSNTPPKFSMERISPCADGDTAGNWGDNDGVTRNGTDALGNAINGTPGQPNSIQSSTCSACPGQVLTEPMITSVTNEPGGVRIEWTDVSADPNFDHYHLYRTTDPTLESNWALLPVEITTTSFLDGGAPPLAYYIPVAVGLNGGVEIEGPSGHYDNFFDR